MSKISFLTEKLPQENIVLVKDYEKSFYLPNGSKIFLSSNKGCYPKTQQDTIAIAENNGYLMMLISDGMGGAMYGEIASYYTAKVIKNWFENEDKDCLKELNEHTFEEVLTSLIYELINIIPRNSGATLTMSIVCPKQTLIANIGDSRTYTKKGKKLHLQTNDDSQAFKLYNPISSQERNGLRFYYYNNIITNAIFENRMPSISVKAIKRRDYKMICLMSDGISDILSEQDINEMLKNNINPASHLVNNATYGTDIYNENTGPYFFKTLSRGKDNASAIIYKKR